MTDNDLDELASQAGFAVNMMGQIVTPAPSVDARQQLRLFAALLSERYARARTNSPRALRPVGSGALLDMQQDCFAKGWKEGQSALRRAIRERA